MIFYRHFGSETRFVFLICLKGNSDYDHLLNKELNHCIFKLDFVQSIKPNYIVEKIVNTVLLLCLLFVKLF